MAEKYMPLKQRRVLENKIASYTETISSPVTGELRNDHRLRQELEADKKKLVEITPPDVTSDAERKTLEDRATTLATVMRNGCSQAGLPPMNSEREQFKNPLGSEGRLLVWENVLKRTALTSDGRLVATRDMKGKPIGDRQDVISEYKDIQRRLYKDVEEFDPSIASIERIRPQKDAGTDPTDYRSRSYVMPANIARIMGSEGVSAIQRAVDECEAAGTAKAPTPEQIYAQPKSADFERCPCFNKKGDPCPNAKIKGKKSCWVKAHQIEVGDLLPKAKRG